MALSACSASNELKSLDILKYFECLNLCEKNQLN